MTRSDWSAGVDIGGTKIKVIQVNAFGTIGDFVLTPTDVKGGAEAVTQEIMDAIKALSGKVGNGPNAVGIGVAGQVEEESGLVKFAPNLKWKNFPLQQELKRKLGVPIVVTNDVRAATWGEWLHGSGKGVQDLLTVFVGTGIGGGIVSDGKMLSGFNNTAGEIGHITVELGGLPCTCGNHGCMEAYAGGWAIAKRAQAAVQSDQERGKSLLAKCEGSLDQLKGQHVMEAFAEEDPLALEIINKAIAALAAGVASLVNAVGPKKIIFGGGVIEGTPSIVDLVEPKIREHALNAAMEEVDIMHAKLHNDAGAIGAGALANRLFVK